MNIKNFFVLGLFSIILFTSSMAFSQSSLERIEKDVFVLASDSLMGRGAGTIYGDRAAQYIFLRFKENGMDPKYQNIKVGTTEKNIYAVIEGSDPKLKNEFIIMGAHYDHLGYKVEKKAEKFDTIIYNGADDNASGSALILEL
ncbi:MAG: M28 family peptidase, partial [Bacteroidales bacterium]